MLWHLLDSIQLIWKMSKKFLFSDIQHYITAHMRPRSIVVIYGPTASGKTSLSLDIAEKYNGEIISADSRIIYQGMVIGTAAPTTEEMRSIPHYFVNTVSPDVIYTVKDFQEDASRCIQDILQRGKLPIVVGGTNMYIDALIDGYSVSEYSVDEVIRKTLEQLSDSEAFQLLQETDPDTAKTVDPYNRRHFIRKLEFCLMTGKLYSTECKRIAPTFFDPIKIGLLWEKDDLHIRIDRRVDIMMEQGMIAETKELLTVYSNDHPAMTSIGYKQVGEYLQGQYGYEELLKKIKQVTRNYAKRQMTWLRAKKDVHFFSCYEEEV